MNIVRILDGHVRVRLPPPTEAYAHKPIVYFRNARTGPARPAPNQPLVVAFAGIWGAAALCRLWVLDWAETDTRPGGEAVVYARHRRSG